MREDRVIVNSDFGKKVTSFFGNPFIALGTGLLLSIFFYVISISSKCPYYFLTSPKVVAKQQSDKLKLTFQGKSVINVYSTDLILWNNGSEFIDQSDFMDSKPTILKSASPIRFLSADVVRKSRPELQFSTRILSDAVSIKMLGDDALETGDGVIVRIFYTTSDTTSKNFNLSSRIKGTTKGFQFVDFQRTKKSTHTKPLIIGWCIIFGLILIRSLTLIAVKRPVVFRRSEIIMLCIALVVWTYYTYEYFYLAIDLHWIA